MPSNLTPEYASGAPQQFASAQVLEERLASTRKSSAQTFDSNVVTLRRELVQKLEMVMLLDHPYASSKDLEARLWKGVFYKVIDDYRKQGKLMASSSPGKGGGEQALDAQRRLRILKGHFRTFLNDTSGFYMRLILKLVAIHGLRTMETALNRTFRTEIVPLSETEKKGLPTASGVPGEKDGAAQAVCRLLMYLGDLARYRTLYSDLQHPDYSAARMFYSLACTLSPDWGNPYNQLAVTETYRPDDFMALYYYLRSLVVPRPFPTSQDNISIVLKKVMKREEAAPGGKFGPRSIISENTWKDEVVRAIASVSQPDKHIDAFSRVAANLRTNVSVPSTPVLTSSLAALMGVLYLLEQSTTETDRQAAVALSRELCSLVERALEHVKPMLAQPPVALLDLVDLLGRWSLRRTEMAPATVPSSLVPAFRLGVRAIPVAAMTADVVGNDARDRWAGFLAVTVDTGASPEEHAHRIREPKVADLARRIEASRSALSAGTASSQPSQPAKRIESIESSRQLLSQLPRQSTPPMPVVAKAPIAHEPEDIDDDEGEEVILFTGRGAASKPPAQAENQPASAQNRMINSPIAQVMTVGAGGGAGSPTLSAIALAGERHSPKPAGIIGEKRPPSVTSPALNAADLERPSTPKIVAAGPKGPAFDDSESRRREILLGDLLRDVPAAEAANRAVSPFPNLPPAVGTPKSDAMDVLENAGNAQMLAGVFDDEAAEADIVSFLGLDSSPKAPRPGSLLMERSGSDQGRARKPPPGLAGSPQAVSQTYTVPEPPQPPNLMDANSAALLAFFRLQQQEAAQQQLSDQLRWQQERLGGLSGMSDFSNPFGGLNPGLNQAAGGLASFNFGAMGAAAVPPGLAGGQSPMGMWANQAPMAMPAAPSNVNPNQMAQLSMLGLHPAQIQMLLQSGWIPPVQNG